MPDDTTDDQGDVPVPSPTDADLKRLDELPVWLNLEAVCTPAQVAEMRELVCHFGRLRPAVREGAIRAYRVLSAIEPVLLTMSTETAEMVQEAIGWQRLYNVVTDLASEMEAASLNVPTVSTPVWLEVERKRTDETRAEPKVERRPRMRPEDVNVREVAGIFSRTFGAYINLDELDQEDPERARYVRASLTLWAVHPERYWSWMETVTPGSQPDAEQVEAIIAEVCA